MVDHADRGSQGERSEAPRPYINGVRRRVAAKGTHKVCRVPPEVYANVALTFATVAP